MDKTVQQRIFMAKKPPYEMTGDYLESKALMKEVYRLYNCGDGLSENSAKIYNYFTNKELKNTEKLLDNKRSVAANRKLQLDKQWKEVQRQEDNLKQMFVKFNQFIIENKDKRQRATQKISDSEALDKNREVKIKDMLEKCEELQTVKTKMNNTIAAYRLYEDFLNGVVRNYPEDFTIIGDILNRYDLIRKTSKELINHQSLDMMKLEGAKRDMAKTMERYVIQISGLQTRVAVLQQRHDAARRNYRHWEELYERVRADVTERLIDVISIRDSCWRIYRDACERKGTEPAFRDDYEKQLEVIKKVLRDYRCINEMARKAEREVSVASERARASKDTD